MKRCAERRQNSNGLIPSGDTFCNQFMNMYQDKTHRESLFFCLMRVYVAKVHGYKNTDVGSKVSIHCALFLHDLILEETHIPFFCFSSIGSYGKYEICIRYVLISSSIWLSWIFYFSSFSLCYCILHKPCPLTSDFCHRWATYTDGIVLDPMENMKYACGTSQSPLIAVQIYLLSWS
jgi:hypothetical protein